MNNIEILIVEDQALVAKELQSSLIELGYSVIASVSNALDAVDICKSSNVDIVLMDIYIKGDTDGIDTAHQIRKIKNNISIIYTTALSDNETIQRAINTNPSSYLIKPIQAQELSIALQIARKKFYVNEKISEGDIHIDGSFVYNILNNTLNNKGIRVALTKKETLLLTQLIKSKNNLVSFYEIENEIWPDKSVSQSTIRSLVSRLKSKLNHKFIVSVSQFGYKIEIL